MRKFFYPRLAIQNIRKNKRFYLPYLLAGSLTAAMFYDLCFIARHEGLGEMGGGGELAYMMTFGMWVVGIFSVIFLFYTNSFLIKHRKKEFGLYNILGMSKGNINALLFCESVITALIIFVCGILFGILISKFLLAVLLRLVHFDVPLGFNVSFFAIKVSLILFGVVFLVNYLYNMICIGKTKPVDLLKGGNVGEREPKTKWILSVVGIICLALGYYMAITVKSPIEAFVFFFIAVILVIVGTYLLFITGSITILKILRRNKKYYYKTSHFTNVSGMIYRMKQNAAGLASICILSTMVLVTVSTTVCLYKGVENILKNRYPTDILVSESFEEKDVPSSFDNVKEALTLCTEQSGRKILKQFDYKSVMFSMRRDGENFTFPEENFNDVSGGCSIVLLTKDEYKKLSGKELAQDDKTVYIYSVRTKPEINSANIAGENFSVKWLDDFPVSGELNVYLNDSFFIVVNNDDIFNSLYQKQKAAYESASSDIKWKYYLDTDGTDSEKIELYNNISLEMDKLYNNGEIKHVFYDTESRANESFGFYQSYGGLLFVGLFFGILFLLATALIIYYKQISEGYDDKERFSIMQNVGMSVDEVKKTINSQILTVFFLPLGVAVLHLAGAFPMVSKLLALFALTDIPFFLLCTAITVLIFAVVYALIYFRTAKAYYKIVRADY